VRIKLSLQASLPGLMEESVKQLISRIDNAANKLNAPWMENVWIETSK
jgi:hypothetical protein